MPGIDQIQLPDRASFHSAAYICTTWAYEKIHFTGYGSRLNLELAWAFGKLRYAWGKLVAEFGAVLLGDRLEIGSHAAYLGQ